MSLYKEVRPGFEHHGDIWKFDGEKYVVLKCRLQQKPCVEDGVYPKTNPSFVKMYLRPYKNINEFI